MKTRLSGCRISGIVGVPGEIIRRIDDDVANFGGDVAQIERIKKALGLEERRVASPGVTALDLCEKAAVRLLDGIDRATIGAVIFVTQTPDHSQPGNATLLHGRLGLPKACECFDVALGCSGYVYALRLAWSLFQGSDIGSVLLCAGDTLSRQVNPRDRSTAPLFGDAGTATLIVRDEAASPAFFRTGSDGSGASSLCVPAGGARRPADATTKIEAADADGNVRSPENLFMNGAEVFNFTLREVPSVVRDVMSDAGVAPGDIDRIYFHQANRFIVNHLARATGFPAAKAPSAVCGRYGNQSSASIPFALAAEAGESGVTDAGLSRVVLCGFGVGLSWGAVALEPGRLDRAEIIEYPDVS